MLDATFAETVVGVAVGALEPWSTHCQARTHTLVVNFTLNPAADPLDALARFIVENTEICPTDLIQRRFDAAAGVMGRTFSIDPPASC